LSLFTPPFPSSWLSPGFRTEEVSTRGSKEEQKGGKALGEKIVGILGGMGPDATVDLFQKILRATPAKNDQEHLRIIIDCNSKVPSRDAALFRQGEDPLPHLKESACLLQNAGAELIAIPCNAAHYWHEQVQSSVRVPVLHIMQAAVDYLVDHFPRAGRVGLLATNATLEAGLYQQVLDQRRIEVVVPDKRSQEKVMEVIGAVKEGRKGHGIKRIIREQGEGLAARGAEAVLAGCTEIPLVLGEGDLSVPVVDATLALALRVVREARG
jgi:aspartate racemase